MSPEDPIGGIVYALDAASGDVRWTYETPWPVQSAPAFANGMVYVASDDGTLHALRAANGEQLWTFTTVFSGATLIPFDILRSGPAPSPSVHDGRVYFAATAWEANGETDGTVFALDARSGEELWRYHTTADDSTDAPPKYHQVAVADGTVIVPAYGPGNCCLIALNAETGTEQWRLNDVPAPPVAVAQGIVVLLYLGGLLAVHAETGQEWWHVDSPRPLKRDSNHLPTIAAGGVFVEIAGDLTAWNLLTGEEVWRIQPVLGLLPSVAVGDGFIVVADTESGIFMYSEDQPR